MPAGVKSGKINSEYLLRLKNSFLASRPLVSFEFFPPKTPEMEEKLWRSVKKLEVLRPRFVSVTYGAGGSTRERTHKTVVRILKETALKPAAHLTCIGATRAEIDAVAKEYWDAGVRHIVALRGDSPAGTAKYQPYPGGYDYASDLVSGLKKIGGFEISVAAYPETHPEALSPEADLDNLKRKIDNGATRAITQYFFDPEIFLEFLDMARKKGIKVPIVPGIIPISHFKQLVKFSAACGASIPKWVEELLGGLDDDPETHNMVAAIIAAEQCRILSEAGINEFHFYTLNRADLTYSVCHLLGVRKN